MDIHPSVNQLFASDNSGSGEGFQTYRSCKMQQLGEEPAEPQAEETAHEVEKIGSSESIAIDPKGNSATFAAYPETAVPEVTFLNSPHGSSLCNKQKQNKPAGRKPTVCLVDPPRESITSLNWIIAEQRLDQSRVSFSDTSGELPMELETNTPQGPTLADAIINPMRVSQFDLESDTRSSLSEHPRWATGKTPTISASSRATIKQYFSETTPFSLP